MVIRIVQSEHAILVEYFMRKKFVHQLITTDTRLFQRPCLGSCMNTGQKENEKKYER